MSRRSAGLSPGNLTRQCRRRAGPVLSRPGLAARCSSGGSGRFGGAGASPRADSDSDVTEPAVPRWRRMRCYALPGLRPRPPRRGHRDLVLGVKSALFTAPWPLRQRGEVDSDDEKTRTREAIENFQMMERSWVREPEEGSIRTARDATPRAPLAVAPCSDLTGPARRPGAALSSPPAPRRSAPPPWPGP